jgi:streptogramin lyase
LLVHGASRHRDLIRPNSVASVSPVTGRVAADVAVGREPSALAFGDGAVWVGNRADQTISRIDLPTRRVTTIGVGTDIRALATGFGALWIAGGSDRTLTKVDLLTGAVQATFTPSASGGAVTAVTTGLGSVWATTADGELLRVDPWHDVLLRRIRVPAPATGIAVAGDALYVTGGGLGSVTTVGRTGLTSSLRTLGPASNPVVTEDGSLWIVAGQQRFLFRGNGYGFDPVDVHGGAHVVGIASAKSDIWVADGSGRLVRLDARTERIVQSIVVRARINAVAARDGVVWLTAGGSNPQ